MSDQEDRRGDYQQQSPRTIESLAVYVQAKFDSLTRDVKRVLVVIEDRQIEKEVALLAERVKNTQAAHEEQKSEIEELREEIDGAKKQIIRYLIAGLVGIIFAIACAALSIIFKLK